MEPRDSYGLRADGRVLYSRSRSHAGRSSQSIWSPTPSASASSTWSSRATDGSCPPGRGRALGDALQNDDRDDTLRPRGVVAEGREIVTVSPVEAVALGSFRDRGRPDPELLGPDLDLSLPMLHEVVVPAGMRRRAALRGGDHVAVAITVVDERSRPDLSALRPARGQQQQLVAEVTDALAAPRVELIDRALVPVRHACSTRSTIRPIPRRPAFIQGYSIRPRAAILHTASIRSSLTPTRRSCRLTALQTWFGTIEMRSPTRSPLASSPSPSTPCSSHKLVTRVDGSDAR